MPILDKVLWPGATLALLTVLAGVLTQFDTGIGWKVVLTGGIASFLNFAIGYLKTETKANVTPKS